MAAAQHKLLKPVQGGVYATLWSRCGYCREMASSGQMGLGMQLADQCQSRLCHQTQGQVRQQEPAQAIA